jgi:dTDP-6-deoxy-L-talose 4-dehydrogenase (NAD+)
MKQMKVLVTGANGYVGQGVVKQLLDDGVEVIATDFSNENIDKRANIKTANIFDIDDPFNYFEKPDTVFHLAWRNGFVHNSPTHLDDLPCHYKFLEKMVRGTDDNKGVKKVAVMGSMHEIGFFEGSIKDSTPCNPQSLYGIGKNALRQAVELLTQQNNILFQWLRGYYIVGNSQYGSSIFSKITVAEKNGQERFPFTTGQNQWDFINYDVFCNQLAKIVEQNKYCGIINACSGHPMKLADRVEQFIKENHYKIKLDYGKYPDRPYDSKAVWGDSRVVDEIMREFHQ